MTLALDREEDGVSYYNETIQTVHHYPKVFSADLVRILPNDIVVLNSNNRGQLIGYTTLRWLKTNGEILSCNAYAEIDLADTDVSLETPQVFCYEYRHTDTDTLPFEMQIQGEYINI